MADVTERRHRIAVVDVSPDTFELLETYFTEFGFDVAWCAVTEPLTAEKLADAVSAVDPDVVIYDIDLPYAASWRMALTLCFDPRIRCPFVFTTTNERVAKQLMADVTRAAVIEKPYVLAALHAMVKDALTTFVRPVEAREPAEDRRQRDRRRGDRRRG